MDGGGGGGAVRVGAAVCLGDYFEGVLVSVFRGVGRGDGWEWERRGGGVRWVKV